MKNTITKFVPPEKTFKFTGTLTPGDFLVDAKDSDSDNTWTAVGSSPNVGRLLAVVLSTNLQANTVGQSKDLYIDVQWYVKLDYTVQFTQVNQTLRSVAS